MELDRNLLEKIRELDDDTLRQAIGNVAGSMGIDPALAAVYLSDMGKIKDTVAGLTQEDLDRVEETLGVEETQSVIQKIRKEVEGK